MSSMRVNEEFLQPPSPKPAPRRRAAKPREKVKREPKPEPRYGLGEDDLAYLYDLSNEVDAE